MSAEKGSWVHGQALALSNVAMRAFRSPASGLATMLAAIAGQHDAELIAVHLIPPSPESPELLATGGLSAARLGPPGKVSLGMASVLASISSERALHEESPLAGSTPWADHRHVISLAILMGDESCCIVTMATGGVVDAQDFYDDCSPVGLLAQMVVDHRTIGKLRKELHEQEQDRSLLNATLHHDLRTPLCGILGSARTLQAYWDRLEPSDRDELLESVSRQSERIDRMLTETLIK